MHNSQSFAGMDGKKESQLSAELADILRHRFCHLCWRGSSPCCCADTKAVTMGLCQGSLAQTSAETCKVRAGGHRQLPALRNRLRGFEVLGVPRDESELKNSTTLSSPYFALQSV